MDQPHIKRAVEAAEELQEKPVKVKDDPIQQATLGAMASNAKQREAVRVSSLPITCEKHGWHGTYEGEPCVSCADEARQAEHRRKAWIDGAVHQALAHLAPRVPSEEEMQQIWKTAILGWELRPHRSIDVNR